MVQSNKATEGFQMKNLSSLAAEILSRRLLSVPLSAALQVTQIPPRTIRKSSSIAKMEDSAEKSLDLVLSKRLNARSPPGCTLTLL